MTISDRHHTTGVKAVYLPSTPSDSPPPLGGESEERMIYYETHLKTQVLYS